jgi:Txe/YoeB family toxin of Txe-Axe toxin-antitoxin module
MRATPYLNKPPDNWFTLLATLSESTFFLMSRHGPSVFKIRDEADKLFKVTLGNPHTCTCDDYLANKFCVHIVFCVVKVLRCDKNHPLCHQAGLTDPELDQLLSGQCSRVGRAPAPVGRNRRTASTRSSVENDSSASSRSPQKNKIEKPDFAHKATRQPLSDNVDENNCPICQDTLEESQALTWCRRGCGANLHAACMLKYSQHKTSGRSSSQAEVLCPLCRECWDVPALKFDCNSMGTGNDNSPGCELLQCHFCKCAIRNRFHRCLECSQKSSFMKNGKLEPPVDYCSDCYPRRVNSRHEDHHFLLSDASVEKVKDVTWAPCAPPFSTSAYRSNNPLLALDPRQVQELQNRDLSMNDYDMLLSLDANPYDLYKTSTILISSLPLLQLHKLEQMLKKQSIHSNRLDSSAEAIVNNDHHHSHHSSSSAHSVKVCWCDKSFHEDVLCVELLCGHYAHQKCMKEDLDVIIREDMSRLMDYRCGHENCGKIVFRCLQRKKKRKIKKPVEPVENTTTPCTGENNMLSNNHHFLARELLPISGSLRSQSAGIGGLHQPQLSLNMVGMGFSSSATDNQQQQQFPQLDMRRHTLQSDSNSHPINHRSLVRESLRQKILLNRNSNNQILEQQQSGLNIGGTQMIQPLVSEEFSENNNTPTPSTAGSSQSSNRLGKGILRTGRLRSLAGGIASLSASGEQIQQEQQQLLTSLSPMVTNLPVPGGASGGGIAAREESQSNYQPTMINNNSNNNNSSNNRIKNTIKTMRRLDAQLSNDQTPTQDTNFQLSVVPLQSSSAQATFSSSSSPVVGRPIPPIGGTIRRGSVTLARNKINSSNNNINSIIMNSENSNSNLMNSNNNTVTESGAGGGGGSRGLDSLMNINHYRA